MARVRLSASDHNKSMEYGTYIREPDGAEHMYHSPSALWNDAAIAFRHWREGLPVMPAGQWRLVTDPAERLAVKIILCYGHELRPGEYVETPGAPAEYKLRKDGHNG